ncbi:MAG: penicillin-binding protein 2, partial [Pseudomonadota bacterium]
MIRVPLRPLARVISARTQGLDPDLEEAERRAAAHRARQAEERRRAEWRLRLLGFAFLVAFATVCGKMAILAATDPVAGRNVAGDAHLRMQRADIVDRNGAVLATNVTTTALSVEARHMVDKDALAEGLAGIFPDLKAGELRTLFDKPGNNHPVKPQISPEQRQAVHELGEPGVFFGTRETRVYPNGQRLGHVLGGTRFDKGTWRAAEIIGVAGLEFLLDDRLGDPERVEEPVRLSIDLRVQNALRNVLSEAMTRYHAKGAAGVLMHARTGEVLSLVSLPDFDPNDRPSEPKDPQLFSRAAQGVYELGSTYKTFTVALAMERGVAEPTTMIDIRGPLRTGGFAIKDYRYHGTELSLTDVLVESSNIGTARLAMEIGTDPLRAFLASLGLFAPSPVELPEARSASPILPRKWGPTETMTVSYGHGIAASPLHLAAAYASISNGGLRVQPTLLAGAAEATEADRVLSAATSVKIRRMLRDTVLGSSLRLADVPGYSVGGKTGTADKPSGGGYDENRVIATFAAIFPSTNPDYVLIVTLDEPEDRSGRIVRRTAGWTAAPVAGTAIRRIAPILGMEPGPDVQPDLGGAMTLT